MHTAHHTIHLQLAKRALYRLPDEAEQVTVRTGTVWVTQGNDPRDIILEPGQSFLPDGHRQVVLYALAPSGFTVRTAANVHTPLRPARRDHAARDLVLE